MAFSRQRKHRHDKSKLIFHDFMCCLIIISHVDPCAGGRPRCQGWRGQRGWDAPVPTTTFSVPGSLGRCLLTLLPVQSRSPALQGCRTACTWLNSLLLMRRGAGKVPGAWERAQGSGWEEDGGGEEERSAEEQNKTKSPVQVPILIFKSRQAPLTFIRAWYSALPTEFRAVQR